MHVKQIIVLGEDLSTPIDVNDLCFLTKNIVGVYLEQDSKNLFFAQFDSMHFYGENKKYIERSDILDQGYIWFNDQKIEVQHMESIDFVSLLPDLQK